MNKLMSLIKVSLTQDMSLFRISSEKMKGKNKKLVPLILAAILMLYMGMYCNALMEQFKEANIQYVALSMFCFALSIVTLAEGVYKSSPLLFNCKDDDLLLSLPISKNTVLFIRLLKFYVFELLFNSLFILPCMLVYGNQMSLGFMYYIISFIALLILPIVPILISCVFGFIMTAITAKFKGKTIFSTIITFALLIMVLYFSINTEGTTNMINAYAMNIHNFITAYYYPVGEYISLVNNFDLVKFLIYIIIHLALFGVTVLFFGKFYFTLNTKIKSISVKHNKKPYVVKTRSRMRSFVKKEVSKFIDTPVFIVNAGAGLVMFLAACVAVSFKFESIAGAFTEKTPELTMDVINGALPVIALALVAFMSFMTSITSSVISLEGKAFTTLKSLPIKSSSIIFYKVLASLVIIVPCLLLGDLILFIRFKFDIISILLILYATILIPFISELIGVMCNLKYPKLDFTNETEIVKQSTSSMVAVFIGMFLGFFSLGILIGLMVSGLPNVVIESTFLGFFTLVALILWGRVSKTAEDSFNKIQA